MKAQAGRKLCKDMYLVERLARFERDRRDAGKDSCTIKTKFLHIKVDDTKKINPSYYI